MALSMLGYRCCSDLATLPNDELQRLFEARRGRAFTAYVNIGSLDVAAIAELAVTYRDARLILSIRGDTQPDPLDHKAPMLPPPPAASSDARLTTAALNWLSMRAPGRMLTLPRDHPDRWELLRNFLDCEYPAFSYPQIEDRGLRPCGPETRSVYPRSRAQRLRFDASPWIAPSKHWNGIRVVEPAQMIPDRSASREMPLTDRGWVRRDDTFPSNLALFRPRNVSVKDRTARLALREESTSVRSFTAGAISSRKSFLHGRFIAELRPSNASGVITGMFLHRNSPRQEIDLEFLGNDSSKALINVFYNPGDEGTRLEFGYRGTPVLVDLGFDAAETFHEYEIAWGPDSICWTVDGQLVHERSLWNPTPVPNLPMRFNVNIWHSRSSELAGRLDKKALPALSEIRSIHIADPLEGLWPEARTQRSLCTSEPTFEG